MIYYIREIQQDELHKRTAGVKARVDLEAIFDCEGMEPVVVSSIFDNRDELNAINKLLLHGKVAGIWKKGTTSLQNGDILIIQFPAVEHTIFLSRVLKKIKSKGVSVILFIHDLELFRYTKRKDFTYKRRIRLHMEEMSVLKVADCIVVHNHEMKRWLHTITKIPEKKMVSLEIFDYLIKEDKGAINEHINKEAPIVISGNLHPDKVGYVYNLPDDVEFNLYGVNYSGEAQGNTHYCGSFSSDEIPFAMQGSFGLVWDGETADTCSGVFGEYLKLNNPHKTSLYLASGMPVAIWDQAALAPLIREQGLGITVSSIADIKKRTDSISCEEYAEFKKNVTEFSKKLRAGYHTKQAVEKCKGIIEKK